MTIGLIGCGKMGSALTLGAIKAGVFQASQVLAFDPVPEAISALGEDVMIASSSDEVLSKSDIILLCVKPGSIESLLSESARIERASQPLIISIAAGITLAAMEKAVAGQARIIRAMPNTPLLVGAGAGAFANGAGTTEEDSAFAQKLLGAAGLAYPVTEKLIDAVTGVSGSGPAYVYTFIEALADGALLEGLPREQALALAAQTVFGSAKMVLESGLHPAELRDRVTSPGGTTIMGIAALEEGSFRSTTIKAVQASAKKARELGAS